ncbi:MAG: hypothetical protein HQK83_05530 [Fibrobacteria bacterium]|nr:hypothetical protein [Fibrobacteria bacterium]
MKILILRSSQNLNDGPWTPYSVTVDTAYAERVIGHLTDKGDYCRACQDKCIACRRKYELDFSEHLAGIIDFPSVLPVMLDDPEEYLPDTVPSHDVAVIIAVNEEIVLSFVQQFSASKGIIIPIERSDVITPNYIQKIRKVCEDKGIVVAFPKPFCSFAPENGVLKEFQKIFKIGLPEVEYTIEDNVIKKAKVKVSAPCGATYFTCRGLIGKHIDDDLQFIIDKQISAYPCTADHAVDREFNDSITHEAVKRQRIILQKLKQKFHNQ